MKKKISKLLVGTITEKEVDQLRDWVNDPNNKSILEAYVRDYHDLNLISLKSNIDEAYNKVIKEIETREKPTRKLGVIWMKYAAVIGIILGVGYLFEYNSFFLTKEAVVVPKNESITLEIGNGTVQSIDINATAEVKTVDGNVVGIQKQDQISYTNLDHAKNLVYNTINIPNGKSFKLLLADGTLVFLNAGSSLRYPVNFSTDGDREVFLTGEAYFNVKSDMERPFIVNVDGLDVKVLGTEFNISAYHEDLNIEVVLVHGQVSLKKEERPDHGAVDLTPGQKGSFHFASENISVEEVNTSLYTYWMQGHLVFRELTFDKILKKLERHYNVEIINLNKELGNEVFNASFEKVDIGEVLGYFNETHKIEYSIVDNKVIIK